MNAKTFNEERLNGSIYYPQEIAEYLADATTDLTATKELEEALYYLFAICQNEHNPDYHRALYVALCVLVDLNR